MSSLLPRCTVAVGAFLAAAAGLGTIATVCVPAAVPLLADGWGRGPTSPLPLSELLSAVAGIVLALCAGWLVLVCVIVLLEVLAGISCTAVRAVTPELARRTVSAACGLALGAGATLPAHASGRLEEDRLVGGGTTRLGSATATVASAARTLTGLRLPDRTQTPLAREASGPGVAEPPLRAGWHVVAPGESLWTIAEALLGGSVAAAEVDALWRALYRENRTVVGADPHLLLPGTRLRYGRVSPLLSEMPAGPETSTPTSTGGAEHRLDRKEPR